MIGLNAIGQLGTLGLTNTEAGNPSGGGGGVTNYLTNDAGTLNLTNDAGTNQLIPG